MINIAVCDDSPIHLDKLVSLIKSNMTEPCKIFSYQSSVEFKESIKQKSLTFEIVFIDIRLGEDSGISLAKEIQAIFPGIQVIFVSQYLDYISTVYETEHIYFIYKGNLEQYIPLALKKALEYLHTSGKQYLEFFWKRESYYVSFDKIIYIERILRTTEIHTVDNTYVTSEKLVSLIQRLGSNFAICHQSFLVNMNRITVFEKNYLILDSNIKIPISRAHYPELKQKFSELVFS